jgi:Flp pilus assembly protein TadD
MERAPNNEDLRMKAKRPRRQITLREFSGKAVFELVHPPGARQRAEDLAEVRAMLAAGETEVAEAELRWLLEGYRELLEAHQLLGQIAFDRRDFELARSHFGRAYEMGQAALGKQFCGRLPYSRPANQPLLAAAKGLALALLQLGQRDEATQVVQRLLALDPSDPLSAAGML